MKLTIPVLFSMILIVGCVQTNRSIIREMEKQEKEYAEGKLESWEWAEQRQMMVRALVNSGYLEYKKYTLDEIRSGNKEQWQGFQDELFAHVLEMDCKATTIEFAQQFYQYPECTNSPIDVEIWDRPKSMAEWDLIITNLVNKYSEPEH